MKAELVSVGTELLLGEIVDTNAAYISKQLAEIGVDVYYRHTIGDNQNRLAEVLRLAFNRSDIVFTTGGLGPTQDDITREAFAEATFSSLVRSASAAEEIRAFFEERNRVPTENNLRQADFPEGAEYFSNSCGTAPGFCVEYDGAVGYALPGPPPELKWMFEDHVLPDLKDRIGYEGQQLFTRVLHLADIGESNTSAALSDIIADQDDPTIAMYASPGHVRIRMATKDTDEDAAMERIQPTEQVIRERLEEHIFGVDDETMETVIGRHLRDKQATVAVAESCTGGLIGSRITNVSGASDYFLGGVIAYANAVKRDVLGVPQSVLDEHGAVSDPCARAMAEGVREFIGADYGLSISGIAGPTGGTPDKPVGTVFMCAADETGSAVEKHLWPGDRLQFKDRTSHMALNLLRKRITGHI